MVLWPQSSKGLSGIACGEELVLTGGGLLVLVLVLAVVVVVVVVVVLGLLVGAILNYPW